MARDWRHNVSREWLDARRHYLTASDIKRLVSTCRKMDDGKMQPSDNPIMARIYGEKLDTEIDTLSTGAMARGHIMEPYAVEDYNIAYCDTLHYWWDDKIITDGTLGFSPDAMDEPPLGGIIMNADDDGHIRNRMGAQETPHSILEIKCYESGSYFQRAMELTRGIKVDERWQIACAMKICSKIRWGVLVLYAPQIGKIFRHIYKRRDLAEEIDMIGRIEGYWRSFLKSVGDIKQKDATHTESEIYNRYIIDNLQE